MEAAIAARADVVVLAMGTNDVGLRTPAELLKCVQEAIERAAPRRVLVALVPPLGATYAVSESAVEAFNAELRRTFPAKQLIDFWTGFSEADLESDGLHITDAAQRRRAKILVDTLATQ